ncbi:28S ribosomal protein S31, mitochondrial [Vespula pensylvanica]|nr:28S ribosomal protein S31, mitochondrial [Vespula pensylvanica]XP_043679337.1 28S ribosomal protein S31, mitochondrial [Vespula pensylvanica]
MLITSVISKGIKFRIPITTQKLHALIKMYSTSSGSSSNSSSDSPSDSSSDSSSDSDSDIQNIKKKKPVSNVSTKSLDDLIDNLLSKDKKKIDVAMPLRKIIKEDKSPVKEKNKSYEAQLVQAAEDIANAFNINKGETKAQLLNRLSNIYKDDYKKKLRESLSKKQDEIISEYRFSKKSKQVDSNEQWKYKADIARKFKSYDKISIIQQLQIEAKRKKYQAEKILRKEKLSKKVTIFKDIKEPTTSIPKLSMWESLEKRELDLILYHSPKNIFQEMIQWTELGILWKFPIDNEIGMEEESNVHFSEHVFLERHLKGWCPKSGPIRHFMELVCVGLSKNPYLSVNEKMNHITWYKEYFKEKKELLTELGAIDVSSTIKEQTKT